MASLKHKAMVNVHTAHPSVCVLISAFSLPGLLLLGTKAVGLRRAGFVKLFGSFAAVIVPCMDRFSEQELHPCAGGLLPWPPEGLTHWFSWIRAIALHGRCLCVRTPRSASDCDSEYADVRWGQPALETWGPEQKLREGRGPARGFGAQAWVRTCDSCVLRPLQPRSPSLYILPHMEPPCTSSLLRCVCTCDVAAALHAPGLPSAPGAA